MSCFGLPLPLSNVPFSTLVMICQRRLIFPCAFMRYLRLWFADFPIYLSKRIDEVTFEENETWGFVIPTNFKSSIIIYNATLIRDASKWTENLSSWNTVNTNFRLFCRFPFKTENNFEKSSTRLNAAGLALSSPKRGAAKRGCTKACFVCGCFFLYVLSGRLLYIQHGSNFKFPGSVFCGLTTGK